MSELFKKDTVIRVEECLKKFKSDLKIIALETTARTAKDAANSLKCELGAIVKSLVFKAENEFLICLIAGDKRCSLNKLKKILNSKDVSMASPNEVKLQTGYTIGGVSPVGHKIKLNILIDETLKEFSNIYAAAGHPNCVFKTNFFDLIKLTNGKIENIIE